MAASLISLETKGIRVIWIDLRKQPVGGLGYEKPILFYLRCV